MGIKGSVTGKHFDRIFTDDIVNKDDRVSRAERNKTKAFYMELQNVKNRGGRIYNTGTPWHEEDCFSIMPEAKKWDCYQTGLITAEELEKIKSKMTHSLFAANYELEHIASDDVIFENPQTGYDKRLAEQGESHIDASYGGEDFTAFTICHKQGDLYYVFGKMWKKHVDDVQNTIIGLRKDFKAKLINCEENADKGYLKKELRSKGELVHGYHETTNKFIKITTYLKSEWQNIRFVEGTDEAYIKQILNYNIDAEHDDAPDSLASIIRKMWGKRPEPESDSYLRYL
jgi:predicted phage terminase large subunit-like protein